MSDIKQHEGLWLPSHEAHLTGWITNRMRGHPEERINGKGTYQYHKLLASLKWVREFNVAVDVGAHCGLWSMHLAQKFKLLFSFEPVGLHRKCFNLNVGAAQTECAVSLHDFALGEAPGSMSLYTTPGSSGDSYLLPNVPAGDVISTTVEVKRMDDVLPHVRVDFIKLDCEGFELFALRGGEALLKRSRPVVVVEQKPGKAPKFGLGEIDAVRYLESLGAVLRREIGGDYIMSWDQPAPVVETVERDPMDPATRSLLERFDGDIIS